MSDLRSTNKTEVNLDSVSVMILAGGLGTRLRSVLSSIPKCLAPIHGQPFLKFQLRILEEAGFRHVILCTGHMADLVRREIGTCYGSIKIDYSEEQELLGTGGALRLALSKTDSSQLLVLNGDSFCEVDPNDFLTACSGSGFAGMVLAKVNNSDRYGGVETGPDGNIKRFLEKGVSGSGWINAGIYLIPRDLIAVIKSGTKTSLEHDVFPGWVNQFKVLGFKTIGKFIDIGTPDSLAEANSFFRDKK